MIRTVPINAKISSGYASLEILSPVVQVLIIKSFQIIQYVVYSLIPKGEN